MLCVSTKEIGLYGNEGHIESEREGAKFGRDVRSQNGRFVGL